MDQISLKFNKNSVVMNLIPIIRKLAKFYKVKNDFSYRSVMYQKMKKVQPVSILSPDQSFSNYFPEEPNPDRSI
jgi:hypothetical protein